MRRLCISIDLDPLSCYYDIHGIEGYKREGADIIYQRAIPRIIDFFSSVKIRPTLFVVGRELEDESVVKLLKTAIDLDYEIANHTYSHYYNFSLLGPDEIIQEIKRCEDVIYEKFNLKIRGFRAPGYNINNKIFEAIIQRGYSYDSSILPSPFYYFTKCGIILLYRMLGRKTKSICGSIRMPFAPKEVYKTDAKDPFAKNDSGLVAELPISVAGFLGIPYVGTFLMGYKEPLFKYLLMKSRKYPLLHIELHGIDFIDRDDIEDERLSRSQFDLNVPKRIKLERLLRLIESYNPDECVRLMDLAL